MTRAERLVLARIIAVAVVTVVNIVWAARTDSLAIGLVCGSGAAGGLISLCASAILVALREVDR